MPPNDLVTELQTGERETKPLYEVWYSSNLGLWVLDKDEEQVATYEDKEDAIYEMKCLMKK